VTTNKKTATIAGILFILAMVTAIAQVLLKHISLHDPSYIINETAYENQIGTVSG
jgi:hypothetical protein